MRSLLLFLLAVGLLGVRPAFAQQALRLVVANYEEAWEFRLDPSAPKAELVTRSKKKAGEDQNPALVNTLRELDARRLLRRDAVAGLDANVREKVKWAEFSPDCQSVAFGYEHPEFDVLYSVVYGHARPWKKEGEFRLRDFNFIKDVAWSADSRFLIVLETEERYSRSPLGLISGLFGHPIPLETLFVTVVEIASGRRQRMKLLSDVPYGTTVLHGPKAACQDQ